jgi:L-ribulose-5-phosphate 3-epimerase
MLGLVDRRTLLKTFAAAAVGSGPPRLLSGCCAYSYGKLLADGKMTMEDFIRRAADLGVVGVELTAYWLKSTEPEYLARLRNLCFLQGVAVAGAACGAQLCEPDGAKRKEVVDAVKGWVDAAELLGAAHLRVFGDKLPDGATEAQGVEWTGETLRAACDYSARKGIVLGIESHTGLTIKAANVIGILKRADSPYAGCNLDISNWQENPYEQIEACLPYATSAHIRDYWGKKKEPLDLDRVWRMFAARGYRGFLNAEYEAEEDPLTGVPKLVDKIKTLCRKYSA